MGELDRQGVPREAWDSALDEILGELDYQRSIPKGPPLPVKAAAVAAPRLLSDVVRGVAPYTPGEDPWLEKAASGIESLIQPQWERQVGEAAEGPLIGKGAGTTWMSLLGQHAPLVGKMAGLSWLGAKGGAAIGGGHGALIGSVALPFIGLGLMETGRFNQEAETIGIDPDIREQVSRFVGPASGAVEEAQLAVQTSPAKAVPRAKIGRIALRALKELGINLAEGLEEVGQGFIFDRGMQLAISRMRARYGRNWEPAVPYGGADYGREMVTGVGLSAITRAGARASRVVRPDTWRQFHKKIEMTEATLAVTGLAMQRKGLPAPTETIHIEPKGFRELRAAIAALTDDPEMQAHYLKEKLEDPDIISFNDLLRLSKRIKLGHKAGTTRAELLMDIESNLGLIKEGPHYIREPIPGKPQLSPRKTLVLDEPIIEKTQEVDVSWNRVVDRNLRKIVKTMTFKNKQGEVVPLTEAGQRAVLFQARRDALLEVGLPETLATHPELNDIGTVRMDRYDQNLYRKLTRSQYIQYTDALEGILREYVSTRQGKKALSALDARLFTQYDPPAIEEEGRAVNVVDIKELRKNWPENSLAFRLFRSYPHMFRQIQNLTDIRMLDFDYAIMSRYNQRNATLAAISAKRTLHRKSLPKTWMRGRARRLFNDITLYLRVSSKEQKFLREQWQKDQFPIPVKLAKGQTVVQALAQRFIEHGRIEGATVEEVLKQAQKVSAKDGNIRTWAARQGAISPEKFRQFYAPLAYEFLESEEGAKGGKTFEEFMRGKEKTLVEQTSLTKRDVDRIIDMGDFVRSLQKKGFPVGGEGEAFYEYARTEAMERLKEVAKRRTDIEALDDLYFNTFLTKFYFEDLAPLVRAFMVNAHRAMSRAHIDPTQFNTLVADYLSAILHVPTVGTQAMQNMNLLSTKWIGGRVIQKGIEWWNKEFGHIVELEEKITPADLARGAATVWYATSLGFPNYNAPIKNMASQSVMSATVGMKTYFEGIARLSDPKRREWIKRGNFRPEFAPVDISRYRTGSIMQRMAMALLYIYRVSDMVNVQSAASAALVAWERLEPEMKKDPNLKHMTLGQVSKILFEEKTPEEIGIDSNEVMRKNIPWSQEYKYEGPRFFRGIGFEIFDRIRRGDVDEAKRMWVQYMVNLSQWRYGAGGTPALMRNPMMRLMTMFLTWPLSYVDFEAAVLNKKNGVLKRAIQIHAAQLFVISILCALGFSAHRWLLIGPEEFGFTGPFADLVSEMWAVFRGVSRAGMAEITPVGEEERMQAINTMKKRWEDLLQ